MVMLMTNDFPLSDDECQRLQLDKREAHVAWLVLHSERGEAAMIRAGYAPKPEKTSSNKVAQPRNNITYDMLTLSKSYARAVEVMSKHFLQVVAAPAALAVQFKLLTSKDTAPGVKHQIGKTLMEMAGYGADTGDKGGAIDLDKLDAGTLDALIQELERKKSNQARTITLDVVEHSTTRGDSGDSVPVGEPDDGQLTDLL